MFCSSSKYKLCFSVPRPVLSHHALAWKHFPGHKGLKYLGMTAQETLSFEWSFSVCLIMLFSPAEAIGYLPLLFSYIYICMCVYTYIHTLIYLAHYSKTLQLKTPNSYSCTEFLSQEPLMQSVGCLVLAQRLSRACS